MKTNILKMTTILLLLAGMVSCGKEENKSICDCDNKANTVAVTDNEGIIQFNQTIQKWCITVHNENTYDEVLLYLPCNMEEEYKVQDKRVKFSGITFDLSFDITDVPAGSQYMCIEISSMSDL